MDNNLEVKLNNLSLQENIIAINNEDGEKWGLPLKELYRLGLSFYRDKSGKAVHLSYEDNIKLIAFTQQTVHGQIDVNNAPNVGVLDVIGKDRRVAWQQLGTISKGQAMEGFIDLLDRLCPLFKPSVEAYKKDKEEKLRIATEEKRKESDQMEQQRLKEEETKKIEQQKNYEELQRRQLQDALNQQTYHQFKSYAEKQYPGNPEQQAILIRQLQNEHYHQYMQQLHAQVLNTTTSSNNPNNNNNNNNSNNNNNNNMEKTNNIDKRREQIQQSIDNIGCGSENGNNHNIDDGKGTKSIGVGNDSINDTEGHKETTHVESKEKCESDTESGEYAVISPANMWTRPDIKVFKQEVSAGKGDGVIRITHGDTVTVRVPTHEGGNCLFWEFATDSYDIGFGVFFEWGKPHTTEVSVHISESDEDEDTLEDEYDEGLNSDDDIESGSVQMPLTATSASSVHNRPILTSIIPVYRRECQNEVYAGSHTYPGEGVYLLKFDNSYSLWRSKTLYYRVFYTR